MLFCITNNLSAEMRRDPLPGDEVICIGTSKTRVFDVAYCDLRSQYAQSRVENEEDRMTEFRVVNGTGWW